jgi:hypothetical protein
MQIKLLNKSIVLKKVNLKEFWLWIRGFPFSPIFLTVYSILFYLDHNIGQVDYHAADRLLLVFPALILFLLLLMMLVLRDIWRAGFVVFVFGLIFFTYPHLRMVLREYLPVLANDNILLPVSILLLAGAFLVAIKASREKLIVLSIYLNGITLILVLIQLTLIFTYEYKMAAYWRNAELQIPESSARTNLRNKSFPDVYFIILDGYARADVLQNELGLDNSPFLDALRKRQFYVADCSQSNYGQTEESLASTLNMMYLDDIINKIQDVHLREEYFAPYIKNNLVRQYLESIGYQTVSFFVGYSWAEWPDATYYLGDPRVPETNVKSLIPFESQFLSRTLFPYMTTGLEDLGLVKAPQITKLSDVEVNRAIVNYTLDELPVVVQLRSPKLVYAHIILPHPPYVFGPNGEEQDLPTDDTNIPLLHQRYRDQVLYANKRILPIIDTILAKSKGNVIIVLEGDHGLIEYRDGAEHMKNLNAYYFPNHDYSDLYPWITPVNSFRVVLSDFFGQNYPLLKDQSYFSKLGENKTFDLIPNPCNGT